MALFKILTAMDTSQIVLSTHTNALAKGGAKHTGTANLTSLYSLYSSLTERIKNAITLWMN